MPERSKVRNRLGESCGGIHEGRGHKLNQAVLRKLPGDVNALNLSGDKGGMWMLDYAFPYAVPEVKQQVDILSRLLAEALQVKRMDW
jgi:hypothetical protein